MSSTGFKLTSWHWEARLLPLPLPIQHAATGQLHLALLSLARKTSLLQLDMHYDPEEATSLRAEMPGMHNFELEIMDDSAAYQHEVEDEPSLVHHLEEVATPILSLIAKASWFAQASLRTLVGYRFSFDRIKSKEKRPNLDVVARRFAPNIPRLGSAIMGKHAQPIGLDISAGYETTITSKPVEMWTDLDCTGEDVGLVRGTLYIQTRTGERPGQYRMTNLLAIHRELIPRIEQLVKVVRHGPSK